jgi:acyl-CoA thioester hydrolase
MTDTFRVAIHGRWPDMDQNGHMRTTAYLDVAEDCRMQYFASCGFSMSAFAELRIGPVVRRDVLEYTAEIRLLEPATVELQLAAMSADGARFRMRNTIRREDGRVAATVTTDAGWLDLEQRRLTAPPEELRALLDKLSHTDDFELLPERSARPSG